MLLMHIHKDRLVGLSRLGCLHTDAPIVDNKPTRAKYRNGAHECIRIYKLNLLLKQCVCVYSSV